MSKEVTKKEENAVVDPSLFAGEVTGFEGTDAQTFKTPFLKILQALSPEMKPSDPSHIKGAALGNFCNTATQDLHESLDVIILKVEHTLVVWRPSRGGFVGRHPKSEEDKIVARRDGAQKWDAEGNEIDDTIELYCVNANDSTDIFIFPMSKASLKHAKSFATRIRMLKANGKPVGVSWAGVWNISTMEEKNEKGSWYTIGSTPDFVRFITVEEKENVIVPALDLLKTAETDYSAVVEGQEDEVGDEF